GFPGNISMNTVAHMHGTAAVLPPGTAAPGATLDGCTVHLGSSANIDSSGDRSASNGISARTALVVDPGAHVATTGIDSKSRDVVVIPVGSAAPPSAAFSPPLAAGDVTHAPPCIGPDEPPGCLEACPVCGNKAVEFPETCDPVGPDACCT